MFFFNVKYDFGDEFIYDLSKYTTEKNLLLTKYIFEIFIELRLITHFQEKWSFKKHSFPVEYALKHTKNYIFKYRRNFFVCVSIFHYKNDYTSIKNHDFENKISKDFGLQPITYLWKIKLAFGQIHIWEKLISLLLIT